MRAFISAFMTVTGEKIFISEIRNISHDKELERDKPFHPVKEKDNYLSGHDMKERKG